MTELVEHAWKMARQSVARCGLVGSALVVRKYSYRHRLKIALSPPGVVILRQALEPVPIDASVEIAATGIIVVGYPYNLSV